MDPKVYDNYHIFYYYSIIATSALEFNKLLSC